MEVVTLGAVCLAVPELVRDQRNEFYSGSRTQLSGRNHVKLYPDFTESRPEFHAHATLRERMDMLSMTAV